MNPAPPAPADLSLLFSLIVGSMLALHLIALAMVLPWKPASRAAAILDATERTWRRKPAAHQQRRLRAVGLAVFVDALRQHAPEMAVFAGTALIWSHFGARTALAAYPVLAFTALVWPARRCQEPPVEPFSRGYLTGTELA